MKNKGFTLIELLAVIVILAIIALIAVPIIINIINDSREKSNARSVELYGKAVENAIAKAQLNGTEIAAGDLSSTFLSTVQYDGSRVTCTTNELYSDGSIYLAGCKVGNNTKEYTYGTSQEVSTPSITVTAATAETKTTGNVPAGNYAAGDEYIIHIGGEDRIFFVLGENASDSSKVDLIMNQNIGSAVAWISNEDFATENPTRAQELLTDGSCQNSGICAENTEGPITANAYLASQTSSWEVTPTLPTKAQIEGAYTGSLPTWLSDYLDSTASGVYRYWIDSPVDGISYYAWTVNYSESFYGLGLRYNNVSNGDSTCGVRPVITISKSLLD